MALSLDELEHAFANSFAVHMAPEKIDAEFKCFAKHLHKTYTREELGAMSGADAVRIAQAWAKDHTAKNPDIAREKASIAPSRSAEVDADADEVRKMSASAAKRARKIAY